MLILTRRPNEIVVVNNNIEIKVLEVLGNQVSLGFTAPREISIYRKEVYQAIQNENVHAVAKGEPAIRELRQSIRKRTSGGDVNAGE